MFVKKHIDGFVTYVLKIKYDFFCHNEKGQINFAKSIHRNHRKRKYKTFTIDSIYESEKSINKRKALNIARLEGFNATNFSKKFEKRAAFIFFTRFRKFVITG